MNQVMEGKVDEEAQEQDVAARAATALSNARVREMLDRFRSEGPDVLREFAGDPVIASVMASLSRGGGLSALAAASGSAATWPAPPAEVHGGVPSPVVASSPPAPPPDGWGCPMRNNSGA